MSGITEIIQKALAEEELTAGEALRVLEGPDGELPELAAAAGVLRRKYKGTVVGVQILTNARSGNCSQNCSYCAQSAQSAAGIEKYSFVGEEKLLRDGALVRDRGLARHCLGLSGIRFTDGDIEDLAARIRALKKAAGTPICCSIGFLTERQAKILKDAGVDRINHNLNSSRGFYPKICSTHTWDERAANIRMLQSLGFEICCGGIIGLGESRAEDAELLLAIRDIGPQAAPVNFLIPLEGTPLAAQDTRALTAEYCLKVLCLARFLLPRADIRCAAGREAYLRGREPELFSIADSIFASGYLTAPGQGLEETLALIRAAGFEYQLEGTGA